MWPLDSAMGATATHRAPEKVANGMCTRVWAWMTDKCKKKMNGGGGYITKEISQKGGREKETEKGPRKRREALGMREELGILVLRRGFPSPWDLWAVRSCTLFPLRASRRLIRAQLSNPLSTNSLWWARSENRDPTVPIIPLLIY